MPPTRTYYDILGITEKAPQQIITAVYYAWMKTLKVHPDLGGDEELAKAINAAYEVLGNSNRRIEYDKQLAREMNKLPLEKMRRAPRTQVDSPIAYCPVPRNEWHSARAVDVSSLGIKFRTDEKLLVGMHIAIAFPGSVAPAIEAQIRWLKVAGAYPVQHYEVGAEFFEPAPDILRRLGV